MAWIDRKIFSDTLDPGLIKEALLYISLESLNP
jgi:hypothetical protein